MIHYKNPDIRHIHQIYNNNKMFKKKEEYTHKLKDMQTKKQNKTKNQAKTNHSKNKHCGPMQSPLFR